MKRVRHGVCLLLLPLVVACDREIVESEIASNELSVESEQQRHSSVTRL